MTTYEKMRSGEIYFCTDEQLQSRNIKCLDNLCGYNHTRPTE